MIWTIITIYLAYCFILWIIRGIINAPPREASPPKPLRNYLPHDTKYLGNGRWS